jgi:hypothetical protein
MLVDLLCFSPLVNVLFLFCLPLLEGRTVKAAAKRVASDIVSVQKAAMKFWIVAHFFNYSMVPSGCKWFVLRLALLTMFLD